MHWRCRLGLHAWVLWSEVQRQEPGEPAWYCSRCGAEPLTV